MNLFMHEQKSLEWWELKIGKISGTRFGQVISSKKNRLVYELMDEILSGCCKGMDEEFVTEDMQYGINNEPVALKLYEEKTGNKVELVGAILSDTFEIHMGSPDGISNGGAIVQEVKCTQHGYTHLERIFEGIDSKYLPQCINYFVLSPEVKEVHFISYCGNRTERPLYVEILKRADYQNEIAKGLKEIERVRDELKQKLEEYSF